jgi:hypothetical protein
MRWRHYIFFVPVAVLVFSCHNQAPSKAATDTKSLNRQLIKDAKATIHTGDIVLRSGKDFTSYRIRELSGKDKTYSHAGIALAAGGDVYIYHITPPDIGEPASDTAMRLETIEQFADPARCFGFGIVRYNLNKPEVAGAITYLDSLYKKKVSFDHFFDLREANKMYCSEMVDNTLRHATGNRVQLERKYFTPVQAMKASAYFHLPMAEVTRRTYIAIDEVELNPNATIVHNYVFLK